MNNYVVDKYDKNFDLLIETLNDSSRNVIAFLGAGVTQHYEFKTWKELILGERFLEKGEPGLVDEVKLSDMECEKFLKDNGEYDLLGLAELCRERMGEELWSEFIIRNYDKLERINIDIEYDLVSQILRTNYHSFITTNFDPVIYKYAYHTINSIIVEAYPRDLGKPTKNSLTYLHGAGFEILKGYEPNIILTQSDYDDAYGGISYVTKFLSELIYFDIVFIGFSLSDAYINKVFDDLERMRNKTIEQYGKEYNPQIFDRKRFVLLPNATTRVVKQDVNKSRFNEVIADEDNSLALHKINVIRYEKYGNEIHGYFPNLIRTIFNKAGNKLLLPKQRDIKKSWGHDEE